jgi:fatty acid synthase subunit alpha, fungi type
VDGICQVVNIVTANSDFAIIMQWTGGCAGGHQSFEDFHRPILATYSSIRHHDNIALVAGSGFGSSDDTWPYLTGDWSKQFSVEPMPFDGFLFASRIMVAKEVHTSPSVRDLVVAAAGVNDSQWKGTYTKDTGGIITRVPHGYGFTCGFQAKVLTVMVTVPDFDTRGQTVPIPAVSRYCTYTLMDL